MRRHCSNMYGAQKGGKGRFFRHNTSKVGDDAVPRAGRMTTRPGHTAPEALWPGHRRDVQAAPQATGARRRPAGYP